MELTLHHNNLTGPLTEGLSSLHALGGLNLFNNNLTGYIPESFGYFNYIDGIALRSNHLTNPIPLSFGSNTTLHALSIDSNEFAGPVPDTILKRMNPFIFTFSGNQFNSLPYYPDFYYYLDVRGNMLIFKDIVPYCLSSSLSFFYYAPQDSILESLDTTVLVGSDITFSSWIDTCQNNKYRWKKNFVFITPLDTNSQLVLNNIQLSDSGNYTCFVTNIDAPLLTLYRRVIHLHVVDSVVGIPERKEKQGIHLRFDLQTSKLSIILDMRDMQYVKCYLYNMMGQKVLRLFEGNTAQQVLYYYLDQLHLRNGLYFVQLEAGNQVHTKKLIIE